MDLNEAIKTKNKNFLGNGRVKLLELIDKTGSITSAAKELGMSYKAAWDNIDAMNNLSDEPIVERSSGGKNGGGTRLTARGKEIIFVLNTLESKYAEFIASLGTSADRFSELLENIRRIDMKTSARNQLSGVISKITKGAVNSEIELDIGDGVKVVSVITNESAQTLELKVGENAFALIKASWIILAKQKPNKISARNIIKCSVTDIIAGAINTEIKLGMSGKTLTSVITNDAVQELELKQGDEAYAIFKASNVILGA